MRKKITLLIVSLLVLFGGSESVWGQIGVLAPEFLPNTNPRQEQPTAVNQQDVSIRRGNANSPTGTIGYINNSGNINNEFGAGESATITNQELTWPTANSTIHTPPDDIQIGSQYSRNIVVNTYNADAYASGAVNLTLQGVSHNQERTVNTAWTYNTGSFVDFTSATYPGWTYPGWTNPLTYWSGGGSGNAGLLIGTSNTTLSASVTLAYNQLNMGQAQGVYAAGASTESTNTSGNTGSDVSYIRHTVDIYLINHVYSGSGSSRAGHWRTMATEGIAPYTSTQVSSVDDGVPLLQRNGARGTTPGNVVSTAPSETNTAGWTPYGRPTTVSVAGTNQFENIIITNLRWWYRTHTVGLWTTGPGIGNWYSQTTTSGNVKPQIAGTYTNTNPTGDGCGCHTGIFWSSTAITGEWDMQTREATTFLDAAVLLVSGANVCVSGNVTDNTTGAGSVGGSTTTGVTDAMLVFPVTGNNYSLLIGGNYTNLQMIHDAPANNRYTAAGFPQAGATDIYLNRGSGANPSHRYAASASGASALRPNSDYYANVADATETTTLSSIFGIFGNYNGIAKIHTADNAAAATPFPNNPGVIEIGPATTGQDLFYIYSGGILKNFWSGCNAQNTWITVGVGGDSPTFIFDGTDPLYILNDGTSNTNSAIIFTAAAATSLGNGYAGATSTGPLHIQARSYVDILGSINFSQTGTPYDNDVAILSDRAYIETSDFTFHGNEGYLTVWAKGAEGSGYIEMNGLVNIVNTDIKTAAPLAEPVWDPLVKDPVPATYNACYPLGGFQAAQSSTALNTLIQTRYQSDSDYITLGASSPTYGFSYANAGDGALFVQGALHVAFPYGAAFSLTTSTATTTADVVIQSIGSYVEFGYPFNYSSNGEDTDIFIDGAQGVTFNGGWLIMAGGASTATNVGIQANDGSVNFYGSLLAPFKFDVTNTDNVQIWANNDINIQSQLDYIDNPGTATFVQFFANDSILTNDLWAGRAPVTFEVTNNQDNSPLTNSTLTEWVAGGNIHTRDFLTFKYGATAPTLTPGYGFVRDLTIQSLGGNIVMDRSLNIEYDSENRILLSAELCAAEKNIPNVPYTNGTGGNRNIYNGNILINDLLNIERTNIDPGVTDILAMYNIRTAKVTMDDASSTGNDVNIISKKGDIFLGYSAVSVGGTSPSPELPTPFSYNDNTFEYTVSADNVNGKLSVLAGYDDNTNTDRDGGGNIYFTHFIADMGTGGTHPAEIMIPYSNEYWCGSAWTPGRLHQRLENGTMQYYEHAGIIGGVGRCGSDGAWTNPDTDVGLYEPSVGPGSGGAASGPSLDYKANNGYLILDAGLRGNIIMNTGSELDFQAPDGASAFFRTRSGDIDLRKQTNVKDLGTGKGLVFLADNGNPDKSKIGGALGCDCEEESNNIYLQDFDFENFTANNNGSIYIGADNNIKLQYGGLKNVGTWKDPFLSQNVGYSATGLCDWTTFHCDSDPLVNQARFLNLDFSIHNTGGAGIVASDLIDIYKKMEYKGGSTTGMTGVPAMSSANGATSTGGSLHGESVSGYGLFIKSQGNKNNWSKNPFDLIDDCVPTCPSGDCGDAYLHQVARVTFHDDARILAENSRAYIGSPVLEVYGITELNTYQSSGNNTTLRVQTDSLILHDDLIIEGSKLQLTTWSNLYRNMPVIKFGHQRFTPPFTEEDCKNCRRHRPGMPDGLDTISVSFRNDAYLQRLHTLIADHTILTFKTDSFEHIDGNPDLDAKIFTDTFKVRNQVELWGNESRTYSGHLELISEQQMYSKDYAGIYTRHLHMEPIAPCNTKGYSELWIQENFLDVITSSTFGGFGTIHSNVHVEIKGKLAPGYASLGRRGNCYEQMAGTLSMRNLTLDPGAELHYSIGHLPGIFGEQADLITVDNLAVLGSVRIYVEKRCDQAYQPGCYPIIQYNSVEELNLNNLLLGTTRIDGYNLSLDVSEYGVVYLCVGDVSRPVVYREVVLPKPPAGVSINPAPGVFYIPWGNPFTFTLSFDGPVYEVWLESLQGDGYQQVLTGVLNANGEYEYTLPSVQTQPIYIYIGPNIVSNELIHKDALVWSNGTTLYINVSEQDIASIYSVTGTLIRQIEVPEGGTSLQMQHGVFIVTLKDGSIHRVIIR